MTRAIGPVLVAAVRAGDIPRVAIVLGTRPEVIKLWPLLRALQPAVDAGQISLFVLSTGQQRDLLDQALAFFAIERDADLDLMDPEHPGERMEAVFGRAIERIGKWLRRERIDRVVVQGDTLSALAAAQAAFYAGIPISHVEAGLRTWDHGRPFPEEAHRRAIALFADQHFCPTPQSLENLRRDGIDTRHAHIVGNTVIDAVHLVLPRSHVPASLPAHPGRRLFVTVHRRENHARLPTELLPAIRRVVAAHPDTDAVVSVHPNPAVRRAMTRALVGADRVHLLAPLDYAATIGLVRQATLVITDSGGLQEEATAIGTPLVVLRDITERNEAVDSGNAVLSAGGAPAIAKAIGDLLDNDAARLRMAQPSDVFGRGDAAPQIARLLLDRLCAVAKKGAA